MTAFHGSAPESPPGQWQGLVVSVPVMGFQDWWPVPSSPEHVWTRWRRWRREWATTTVTGDRWWCAGVADAAPEGVAGFVPWALWDWPTAAVWAGRLGALVSAAGDDEFLVRLTFPDSSVRDVPVSVVRSELAGSSVCASRGCGLAAGGVPMVSVTADVDGSTRLCAESGAQVAVSGLAGLLPAGSSASVSAVGWESSTELSGLLYALAVASQRRVSLVVHPYPLPA